MLEVKDICMKFKDKKIFDNYCMKFEDNNIYSIMGKSGCGKSTLLRMLAGLQKPNSGSILYDNTNEIKGPNRNIFMMHQRYANFPWKTCLQNILFPIKLHRKITQEDIVNGTKLLDRVGLLEYENKYPYELSGGMQQRLALARVILSNPKVILMDEPLSALDPVTRSSMQELIIGQHKMSKNIIIMVTHDPDEAKKMGDYLINL